jgi:hypothetical protein
VFEQWRYGLGSSLEDTSRRRQAVARERECLRAPVPARAPFHQPRLNQPVDETACAGLRQPDDTLEIADGPSRVRLQVDKRSRPAALLRTSGLRGLAHTIGDSQRLRRQELLEPAVIGFHASSIQA